MSFFSKKLNNFNQRPLQQRIAIGAGALVAVGALNRLRRYVVFRYKEKSLPFNGYTTNAEAINGMDMKGRIALVTGANNGIGKETTRILAKQGCTVIMACRTVSKGETAKREISESLGLPTERNKQLEVIKLDLSSLKSVETFAKEINDKNIKIDYLINNAGVMAIPEYSQSQDGYEMQFATNHLGHFYLTNLIMKKSILRDNNNDNNGNNDRLPRIINLSSSAHRFCPKRDKMGEIFDDAINCHCFMGKDTKKFYDKWANYGISKAANILFTRELQERYNNELIAVSVHPGAIQTGLGKHMTSTETLMFLIMFMTNERLTTRHYKTIDQGAACTLRAVSMNDNEIGKGHYYENCQSGDDNGWTGKTIKEDKDKYDGTLAKQLWQLSEVLIREKGFALDE